jgi:hypothetical protein
MSSEEDDMTDSVECCGWASWGELAGMGDGSVKVEEWEERGARAAIAGPQHGSSPDAVLVGVAARGVAAIRHSGQRARAELAVLRWRLAERNKRG